MAKRRARKTDEPKDNGERQNQPGAVESVREVLEIARMNPQPIEGGTGFTATFADEGPPVTAIARVFPDENRFVFYLELVQRIPETFRPQVAEFITRANYGLSVGNFELDYSTGTVRFKTSVDFQDSELPPVLVRNAVLAAMDGVEVYSGALAEVIEGKKSPKDAIDEVESSFGME